jgi:hypothetical protein
MASAPESPANPYALLYLSLGLRPPFLNEKEPEKDKEMHTYCNKL